MDTIGKRLKFAITDRGAKNNYIAEKLGINKNYLSMVLSGSKNPSDKLVEALCNELQISKEWVLTGEGDMNAPSPYIQELTQLVDELLTWDESEFRTQFIKDLVNLPIDKWHIIEEFVDKLKKADE